MIEAGDSDDKITARLRLTARIWSLILLGIVLIVVVGNIASPNRGASDYPQVENLIPLTMLLSVLGLAVAWRWELPGGLINIGFFLAVQVIYWIIHREFLELLVIAMLSPIFIPGVLFLVCWSRSRKIVRSSRR
jgi:hypothetical protein